MAEMSGGEKLQEYLEKLSAKVATNKAVSVGFLEGSGKHSKTNLSIPTLAAIHEFGAPNIGIPPRPFFRQMIKKNASTWGPELGAQLKDSAYDAEVSLGRMGLIMQGQLRLSIAELTEPPLKPRTIKIKGFAKPLVETGEMQSAVDYEVKA